jgi:hypothetical protein
MNDEAERAALAQLLLLAEGVLVIQGEQHDTSRMVCREIRASGNTGDITDVICLEGGSVEDNFGIVHLLCPYRVQVSAANNLYGVTIWHHAYAELLERAEGYGRKR